MLKKTCKNLLIKVLSIKFKKLSFINKEKLVLVLISKIIVKIVIIFPIFLKVLIYHKKPVKAVIFLKKPVKALIFPKKLFKILILHNLTKPPLLLEISKIIIKKIHLNFKILFLMFRQKPMTNLIIILTLINIRNMFSISVKWFTNTNLLNMTSN